MSQLQSLPAGARFMYVVGIVAIVGVALYFAFMAVDGYGLEEEIVTARVLGKEIQPAGSTYATQIINGRRFVTRQATPEMYLLTLDLEGEEALAAVEPSAYEALAPGDEVRVVYQTRRITGSRQVIDVRR